MNDSLAFGLGLAIGVVLGAVLMFVAMRGALHALRDSVAVLSAALHPDAPVPDALNAMTPFATERPEVDLAADVRAERMSRIRRTLEEKAMAEGKSLTDEVLDAEAERLAGADVYVGV